MARQHKPPRHFSDPAGTESDLCDASWALMARLEFWGRQIAPGLLLLRQACQIRKRALVVPRRANRVWDLRRQAASPPHG